MDRSSVFHRDMLDDEHAAQFAKPWLFEADGHGVMQFDTEEEACREQRAFRLRNGFNPVTGERQ